MSEELIKVNQVGTRIAVSYEHIVKNVEYSKKVVACDIDALPDWRKNMKIAIVGGGPSLQDHLEELRDYQFIMAAGSVHDYLYRNYIVPDWCVLVDPDPIMKEYVRTATKKTKYLVATQCAPELFNHLMNRMAPIYKWNALQEKDNDELFGPNQIAIGGGCTVGTRAIMLAYYMGFYQIDLFGFDCCIKDGKSHAYDFVNPEKEKIKEILDIMVGDVKFTVAGYHLGQLVNFRDIVLKIGHHVKFTVHSDGPMKTMLELSEKGTNNVSAV